MDRETAVMTAIIILICAFPFIILGFKKYFKRRGMLDKIKTLAAAQGCTITQSTCEADIAIGIDENEGSLFFYKSLEEGESIYALSLHEFSLCCPHKVNKIKGKGKEKYEVIMKLGMALKPRDKTLADTVLIFYNADESAHLGSQFELMNKWVSIVQSNLESAPKKRTTRTAKAS